MTYVATLETCFKVFTAAEHTCSRCHNTWQNLHTLVCNPVHTVRRLQAVQNLRKVWVLWRVSNKVTGLSVHLQPYPPLG